MVAIPSPATAAHATNQNANSNTAFGADRIKGRFDSSGSDRKNTTFAPATPTAIITNPTVATANPNIGSSADPYPRLSGGSEGWLLTDEPSTSSAILLTSHAESPRTATLLRNMHTA